MKVIIDIPEIPTNDKQRWALANGKPYLRGEWVFSKYVSEFKCSLCGSYGNKLWNFCPHCGADMRDKKDDLIEIIEAVQSIKEGET